MGHATGTSIERSVLSYVKSEGWGGLSSVKTGKEKIPISCEAHEPCASWVTTRENILDFTGAYRKVLIDYFITGYIAQLDADKGIQAEYAILGDDKLGDVIRYTAFGSKNATSDYDVTLSGPCVHKIVGYLMTSFADLTAHDKSMAFVFDSNFYIVPELLIPLKLPGDDVWTKHKIKLFRPYVCDLHDHHHPTCMEGTEAGRREREVAVPVPDGDIIEMEWNQIMTKLNQPHASSDADALDKEVLAKYANLVRLGADLDAFVYKGDKSGLTDKAAFFRHLFAMKQTSIESYVGVSTVMAVVYGMQAGRMECVHNCMTPLNFENACLENLLDFTNHWNAQVPSMSADESHALRVFVKLSKYLQRVLVCLAKALESEPNTKALFHHTDFVDQTVRSRSGIRPSVEVTTDHLRDFGCFPINRIDLASDGGKGLVYTVYRRLVARRQKPVGFGRGRLVV